MSSWDLHRQVLKTAFYSTHNEERAWKALRHLVYLEGPEKALSMLQTYRALLPNVAEKQAFVESYRALDNPAAPANPKKIAVVLTGNPRTYAVCYPTLKRFFHGHEVDIYLHCWEQDFDQALVDLYQPAGVQVEQSPNYAELAREGIRQYGCYSSNQGIQIPYANPHIYPMWHAIRSGYDQIPDPESYDLICRNRYDLAFLRALPVDEMPADQITLDRAFNVHQGVGDQLAIAEPGIMGKYFHFLSWLEQGFDSRLTANDMHPENLLHYYLTKVCGATINAQRMDLRLVRSDNAHLPLLQQPIRTKQASIKRDEAVHAYCREHYADVFPG